MHVVDNKLVGTIVSDVYTENGSVIIVLTDNDTTPVREMQTYSYIQTKELAEIGIAINPKGVVTIPVYTLAGFSGELDSSLYAITVKYNGELYQIGLADFIELTAGEAVDYVPYVAGTYPGQTTGAVIPPFSDENAGQIVSVNEETGKLEWRDETEELPTIGENDGGKVLKVNDTATGIEWVDIPDELPSITGNAGKVLTVNAGETGVEWRKAGGGTVIFEGDLVPNDSVTALEFDSTHSLMYEIYLNDGPCTRLTCDALSFPVYYAYDKATEEYTIEIEPTAKTVTVLHDGSDTVHVKIIEKEQPSGVMIFANGSNGTFNVDAKFVDILTAAKFGCPIQLAITIDIGSGRNYYEVGYLRVSFNESTFTATFESSVTDNGSPITWTVNLMTMTITGSSGGSNQ